MCQPGPARAPQRLPRRLAGRRGLPQDEVERVALVGVVRIAAPLGRQRQHGRPVQVADLAEPRERRHAEVHAATGLVGVAGLEHHPDEAEDVGDGRGGPRLAERRQEPEGLHVGVEAGHLLGRQVEVVHAELAGLAQDVVVDVGDVADALGLVAQVPQPALQHVVGQVGGGVAEVGGVVRRDAAGVHRHDRARLERHHRPPGGVVEAHRAGRRRSRSGRPVSRMAAWVLYRRLTSSRAGVSASMARALDEAAGVDAAQAGQPVDEVDHFVGGAPGRRRTP